MSGLVRASGELAITPESAGWTYSGLRVLELAAGEGRLLDTGEDELIVLPLSGACTVRVDGEAFELAGRESVFTGVTDFAYAPRDASLEIASAEGGRFALPAARASERLQARHVPAEAIPIELRGAGQASRQVNNFCSPEAFAADRLIAVEVLTPGTSSSCLCGGYEDQLPAGVRTSTAIRRSAANASGAQKLLTWRLAWPAPRSSTGTSGAATWRASRRRSAREEGRANRPPSCEVTSTRASRGT